MSNPDPLQAAAPAYDDPDAKRARAGVAAALFGGTPARVRVGRYELIGRLGAGGMGVVHRAHDPELDRPVAVKLLRAEASSDDKARARMLREARALAKLSHPNVITVYDVGTLESDDGPGQVFVAMELVAGKDLRRWLAERRNADPGAWMEVLEHFVAAGRGLQAAHEAGLIHRDFKPENVLVGDDGRVRVLDFGLARPAARLPSEAEAPLGQAATGDLELSGDVSKLPTLASQRGDGSLTETGAMLGTPLYMAPELYDGKPADAASDQFAYCASLWEGLYGRRPFGAETLIGHVDAVRSGAIVDPPADSPVPSELHRILRRGLDPEPARRFSGMHALLAELEAFVRQASSGASRIEPPRTSPWRSLVLVLVVLVGLAAVIGIVGFQLGWFGGAVEPPTVHAPQEDRPVDVPAPATTSEAPSSGTSGGAIEREPATSSDASAATPAPTLATSGSEGTGEGAASEGEASEAPSVASEPEQRDYCHLHEDSYTLLARTPRKKTKLSHQGTCYECRVEQRSSRTKNFSPRDCAGYLLCGPTAAEACP